MSTGVQLSHSCSSLCHLKWGCVWCSIMMTLSLTVRDPLRRRQSQISVTRCLWSALVTHSVPAKSGNVRVLFCPQMHPSPRMLTQRTAAPSSVVSGHLASHCPRLSYLGPHSTRKIVSWQQNSSEHCLWFPTKIRSWLNFLIIPLKWLAEPGLVSWSVLTTPAISRLDNKTYRRLTSKCIYSVGKVGSSIFHFSFFILIISARSFLYEKN